MIKRLYGLIGITYLMIVPSFLSWSYQIDFSTPDLPENLSNEWLSTTIQTKLEKPDLKILMDSLEEMERRYLYQTDENLISFDSLGDPLMRSSDPDLILEDRANLERELQRSRDTILKEWDHCAASLNLDLLNKMPLSEKNRVGSEIQVQMNDFRDRVRKETEQLIRYSLARFDSLRKEDQYSLRKKSEDVTALSFTEELLRGVQDDINQTDRSLKELTDDVSFSLENREESFQLAFQKGLDKWDRAEKALMNERIDWEMRVEDSYLKTEEEWDTAFNLFAQKRKEWIREMNLALEKGSELWEYREQEYLDQFQMVSEELEITSLLNEKAFTEELESLLKVYRESASLLESAEESIRYFEGKINYYEGIIEQFENSLTEMLNRENQLKEDLYLVKKNLEDNRAALSDLNHGNSAMNIGYAITKIKLESEISDGLVKELALQQELESISPGIIQKKDSLEQFGRALLPYIEELPKWLDLKKSFKSQMDLAEEMLVNMQARVYGYDQSVPVASLDNEIKEMTLRVENLYQQWQISEAVTDYAEMNCSLRPSDARTRESYENARQLLHLSAQAYQEGIGRVGEISSILKELQGDLESGRSVLETIRQELNRAHDQYEASLSIYRSGDSVLLEIALESLDIMLGDELGGDALFNQYKESVVDENYREYIQILNSYEEEQATLNSLSRMYKENGEEFQYAQNELDELYSAYRNALRYEQQTGEILDYAQCAYTPSTMDIYSIRDDRKSEYEKSLSALNVLKSIKDSENSEIVPDALWALYLEEVSTSLNLQSIISLASEEFIREIEVLNREKDNAEQSLREEVLNCFNYKNIEDLDYHINQELLDKGLSDCTVFENSELSQYFNQDNISEIFTKDALLWLQKLESIKNSSTVLKNFSFAYYHELVPEIQIPLFENPQHQNLLDQSGTFWKGVSLGYSGSIENYLDGLYDEVDRVIYNLDGTIRRVYITPREWLKEACGAYYRDIRNNPSLFNLYSFYKIVMDSQLLTAPLESAMSQDLSGLAWSYFDAVCKKEQQDHKNFLGQYDNAGKAIRAKRETINDAEKNGAFDGSGKRQIVSDTATEASIYYRTILNSENEITVVSRPDISDIQAILSIIEESAGVELDRDQIEIIRSAFNDIPISVRNSCSSVLTELNRILRTSQDISAQKTLERQDELMRERNENYHLLKQIESNNEWDIESYKNIAVTLFNSKAYLPEEYDKLGCKTILTGTVSSREGYANILEQYATSLISAYRNRLDAVKQSRYQTLQNGLEELYQRKEYWESRTAELLDNGMKQWFQSTEKIIEKREEWRQELKREYDEKEQLWEKRYETFIANRNSWLNECAGKTIAADLGINADSLIGEVSFQLIPDISFSRGTITGIVEETLRGRTVPFLLKAVRSLTNRSDTQEVNSLNILAYAPLPILSSGNRDLTNLITRQKSLKEKIQKAFTLAQALQMTEVLLETDEMIDENIKEANRSVDQSLEEMFLNAGYARTGSIFIRTAIIDSSLLEGPETESHRIGAYRDYCSPSFDHGMNLSVETLKNLNSTRIQARVNKARENMMTYLNLIFGNEPEEIDGLDQNFLNHLETQEKAFAQSPQYAFSPEKKETKGLFNYYLGYAPVMDKDNPEKIAQKGYGEMGRIYKDFLVQQARLYRGFAAVDTPSYNQKLWDDDSDNDGKSDSMFGAPTLRSLSDIALSISCSALLGPGAALVVGMMDDAVFTMMDMKMGVLSTEDAAWGFTKKAASSALALAGSWATQKLDSLTGISGSAASKMIEITTDMGNAGASTALNIYGNAAIDSIRLDGSYDWNNFNRRVSWDGSAASYLGSMAGAGITSSFETASFGYINSLKRKSDTLGSLAGGLGAAAVQYGMTGEAKFNVLNLSMLGIKGRYGPLQSGLVELNLGKNSNLMNIGTGGTDISLGTLKSAIQGSEIFSRNREIKQSGISRDLTAAMRAIYSAEKDMTSSLYDDILKGRAKVTLSNGKDYEGVSEMTPGGRNMST